MPSQALRASSPKGRALGKEGQLLRACPKKQTPPTPCQKHSIEGGLFSKSRFHSGLSLKADNGGHPRCDTQLPAACCPGALHAAVCKQASSQRPVLSAQTMQRYSARINAFILLQTYYNSRRGVSQAFDSPARLVLHWAKMQPGGFIMQLRRRFCTGWGSCRPGLWARKGRGLFCAKSLDSIAKSALSPFTSPATCAIIYFNIAVCVFNGLAASANCISQICCYP